MKNLKNEKGSALFISLCLLTMITLIAIASVDYSGTDAELSYNQSNSEKAFYIADAGAKRAFMQIKNDPSWRTGYNNVSFNNGTFNVTVTDSTANSALADTVIITAEGWNLNSTATIELIVAPDINYPFLSAMFARDSLLINNSMTTDSYNSDSGSYLGTRLTSGGDVGSNGGVDIRNGAYIGGNASTSLTGALSINPGATVTGTTSDAVPEAEVPDIPDDEFDWAETVNDASTGIVGSYSYDPSTNEFIGTGNITLLDGVYFFSSFTLKNTANVTVPAGANVTIYVDGDIELKNSSSVNSTGDPNDLVIYSKGDFVLKNSGDIHAVFYTNDGEADLRNSGDFYGAIVADHIHAHNSSSFHYDRNLGNFSRGGGGGMEAVAWSEK